MVFCLFFGAFGVMSHCCFGTNKERSMVVCKICLYPTRIPALLLFFFSFGCLDMFGPLRFRVGSGDSSFSERLRVKVPGPNIVRTQTNMGHDPNNKQVRLYPFSYVRPETPGVNLPVHGRVLVRAHELVPVNEGGSVEGSGSGGLEGRSTHHIGHQIMPAEKMFADVWYG